MKKNKLGNLFKIGILFFGISLFLFGCEQQSELNQEIKSNITQENSLKKKSLNQLSNDNQFNTLVEKFRIDNVLKNGSNLLLAKKSDSQISIDTDSIVEIKKENYTSYTFRLKNQNNTSNGVLENLVIEQRNDTIQGFLIKYKFSEFYLQQLKKGIKIPFQGKIQRTKYSNNIEELFNSIENSKSAKNTAAKSSGQICETYTVTVSTTCASGKHKVGQTCDYTGTSRAASSREFTSTNCWYDDSGWSDYDTVLDYIASDNPSSGGSSTSPNTQSCNSCYENLIAKDITTKLGLFAEQEQWLKTQSEEFLGDIDTFLKNNPNSFETEKFTREVINSLTNNTDLDITPYLNDIVANPSGVSSQDYDPNDPILGNQILLDIVNNAIDGFGNLILIYLEYKSHPANEGKILRFLMPKMGLKIPADIPDETLGELFSLRKRNRSLVVEYQDDTLKGLIIDVAVSAFDVVALISPSKGGGAYLLTTGGKTVTLVSLSNTLKTLKNKLYTFRGPMLGKTIGHTYKHHGSHLSEMCKMRAINGDINVGQWLDDLASENFIAKHLSQLNNGAIDIPIPSSLQDIGRSFRKGDGVIFKPTHIRLVPGGSGVKTAFPINSTLEPLKTLGTYIP